jgi:hypothetical protein
VLTALLHMNLGGERSVRLVVNSRMDLGGGLEGADQIHLEALPASDARQLLMVHAGQEVRWEGGQAAQLVEICRGNALALTLVGGLLAARRCTPEVRYCSCPHAHHAIHAWGGEYGGPLHHAHSRVLCRNKPAGMPMC